MGKFKFFKKSAAIMLAATMAITAFTACGSKTENSSADEEDDVTVLSGGADDGAELEMWTFVDLHAQFYLDMVDLWNENNPDEKINLNVSVLPYGDMHNKLRSALLAGKGAPDLCDIEVGQFPNFLKGEPQLETLNDVVEPYKDSVIQSRLDLYSKDGDIYGVPTHVGAVVAFYNTELLGEAGIDYTTIKTWDDFESAGIKYYEATGKYLGTCDTGGVTVESLMLAEKNTDLTDDKGNPQVNSSDMVEVMTLLKKYQEENVLGIIPGGIPDVEEAYGEINEGNYACVIMPMWFMSRYLNYMPELSGKIAIAKAPVFDENEKICSFGGGGTGTVVTNESENVELAKKFIAYAKLSEEGNVKIWEDLGFDPVNTDLWSNNEITHNPENEYVKYFINNPFDILLEIKDSIGLIKSVEASPDILSTLNTTSLNSIFEDDEDVKDVLDDAQEEIENSLK